MRVRSSAASACGQVGAGGDERRFRPGRRRQRCRPSAPCAGWPAPARADPWPWLTASRALSTSASLTEPARRALQLRDRPPRGLAPAGARHWRRRPRPSGAPGALPDTSVLSRSRLRIAASARAALTRPISSSSSSRTSRSPAATLSLSATSTSAMRPGTCAPMRTSPPDGSTRPGGGGRPRRSWTTPRLRLGRTRRPWRVAIAPWRSRAGLALKVCGT